MPANTSNIGLPYPVAADLISTYPTVAKQAADKLDALLAAMKANTVQRGVVTNQADLAANGARTVAVTFPTPFTSPPVVTVTPFSSSIQTAVTFEGVSNTGASVTCWNSWTGGPATGNFRWIAVGPTA